MKKPFVHLMETPKNKYAFDVNTNQLIRLSNEVYDYLKTNCNEEPDENVMEQIDELKKQGFLSSNHPQEIIHPDTDNLEYLMSNKLSHITLQVTQNCNFMCSYCPYTTAEFGIHRSHSSKNMTVETARKAIEFLADRSADSEMVFVSFYGGEPLLRFDLLKKCVEYAEELFIGKELTFAITTNGSIINNEILDFLNSHNFNVMMSIDGPRKIHNRSRKFAATGRGTFDTIEKNLIYIYENYRDFFKRLTVNMVMDTRFSNKDIHEMFSSHEMYKELSVRTSTVDEKFSFEKSNATNDFVIDDRLEQFKLYASLIGKYPREKVSSVSLATLKETMNQYMQQMKSQKEFTEVDCPSGACIPGHHLFCDVSGRLSICEKVSETSPSMYLGNLDDGFDFENARKLLNIGNLTAENCKNCFAFRNCMLCAKHCDNNGELSSVVKRSYCRESKSTFLDQLKMMVFYYEYGIDKERI